MAEILPDNFQRMAVHASLATTIALGSVLVSAHEIQENRPELYIMADALYDNPNLSQLMPYVVAVDEIDRSSGVSLRGGTGTLIGGYVLTAGHVYEHTKETSLGDPCGHSFTATRDRGPADEVNTKDLQEVALQSVAAEDSNTNDLSKPDWAVFKADTTEGLDSSVIAEHQPKPGEIVTFTNYQAVQSTTGGDENVKLRHPILKDNLYDDPAVFKGLIIGRKREERIAVLTAIDPSTTFSSPGDNTLIGGGSGGPVWNTEGELVGLSNNKSEDPMDARQIAKELRVNVVGAKEGQKFSIDWIQPIEEKDFTNLKNSLQPCDFDANDLRNIRSKQPPRLVIED